MDYFYEKMLVELKCPVCLNYMKPPIRQCKTGHSICESCRNKLLKCPLCQENFTNSKNISLEAVASKMYYPCTNKERGCHIKLTLEEIENHEKCCSFRGFKCPMEQCFWIGSVEELLEHWASKPNKNKIYSHFNVCHTKIKRDCYYTHIVQACNQIFCYKLKVEKGNFFWAVQYLGNKNDANNYFYTIEVTKPGMSNLKVIYTDYCQSYDIDNNDLFTKEACVTADVNNLTRFIGQNQLLIHFLKVNEVEEPSKTRRDRQKAFKQKRSTSESATKHQLKNNSDAAQTSKYKQMNDSSI